MRTALVLALVTFTSIPPLLQAQAVHLEAEDALLTGANLHVVRPAAPVSTAATDVGYTGTGYVTGFVDPADRLVFTYQSPKAGIYDVHIGYRSNGHLGYELEVNGFTLSGSFQRELPGTFASENLGHVELKGGVNTLTISRGWRNYDIDFLEIAPAAPITPPLPVSSPPSDPDATFEARALLRHLEDTYGHGSLLGLDSDADLQYVLETTGSRPSIMEGDLSSYSPASVAHNAYPGRPQDMTTERMIAHAKEGYTVTMCWHWVSPSGLYNRMEPAVDGKKPVDQKWYRGFYTEATSFDVSIAMSDPLSEEHALLLRDIDAIAVQLKKFQAANVPVLWRPLHEAQGKWFWWGAKGPEAYTALWRLMYDRLVNVDGVHNLIWVFTSADDPAWYPGDAYVDIVGIDAYPKDLRDPQSELWANLSQRFAGKKLLAVSEFGGVPDVAQMHRLGNDYVYAVSWNGVEGPRKNRPEALKAIYAEPFAIKSAAPAVQAGAAGSSRP